MGIIWYYDLSKNKGYLPRFGWQFVSPGYHICAYSV